MIKKLAILQGILLVLLCAAIALLGLAVYAALRGDDTARHNSARFVKTPIVREARYL